jgi:hypothetical protein
VTTREWGVVRPGEAQRKEKRGGATERIYMTGGRWYGTPEASVGWLYLSLSRHRNHDTGALRHQRQAASGWRGHESGADWILHRVSDDLVDLPRRHVVQVPPNHHLEQIQMFRATRAP